MFRLADGKLDEVALPPGETLRKFDMDQGRGFTAVGSRYIYTKFGNAIYRVGDTGDFSPVPLRGGDVGNVYKISGNPGLKGEIAFAAEDKGSHSIIELKPDGTEKRRTPAKGKVVFLVYLNF